MHTYASALASSAAVVMDHNTMAPNFTYREPDAEDIDLGLSLSSALQQVTYNHPSGRYLMSPSEDGELMGWPQQTSYQKRSNAGRPAISEDDDHETQGVQSKERWSHVKVNMDGVAIGREVCIFDHADYSSLALELEHLFGGHTASGLKFLENESGFCLLYLDRDEKWRTVGDVPWKDFIDSPKRLRITPRG